MRASHRATHLLDRHPVRARDLRGRDGDSGRALERHHPLLGQEAVDLVEVRNHRHARRLQAPRVRAGVTNIVWFWRLLQCVREFEAVFPPVNSTFKPSIRIKAGVAVADNRGQRSQKNHPQKVRAKIELFGVAKMPGQTGCRGTSQHDAPPRPARCNTSETLLALILSARHAAGFGSSHAGPHEPVP